MHITKKITTLIFALFTVGIASYMLTTRNMAIKAQHVNEEQAGGVLFANLCATCHGPGGDGSGGAPNLSDGHVLQKYPTSQALSTFIQQRMPATAPGTLNPDETRDLVLYIQRLNRGPS
ncbi:c-type cytochrome [Sulfobacillus thermosulfidooxidans]|uniref:c-type cytochrome n=1 Tax=Sulfobacillus thermosulfidooxidans TaxID=28034 RepID=UPI0006B65983|nr:c-type cytochrome [Sulfobacillus thermosulfidooxidans]